MSKKEGSTLGVKPKSKLVRHLGSVRGLGAENARKHAEEMVHVEARSKTTENARQVLSELRHLIDLLAGDLGNEEVAQSLRRYAKNLLERKRRASKTPRKKVGRPQTADLGLMLLSIGMSEAEAAKKFEPNEDLQIAMKQRIHRARAKYYPYLMPFIGLTWEKAEMLGLSFDEALTSIQEDIRRIYDPLRKPRA